MAIVQPAFLKSGDKVALISTARKVSEEEMGPALALLRGWGLEVVLGEHLFFVSHQFAGTDEERCFDLQRAMDDPSVKAIFCARGGYGTPRIIDDIRWSSFLQYPKWIVGFSDVTTLLTTSLAKGVASLHAPLALFFNKPEYLTSIEQTKSLLFGKMPSFAFPFYGLNELGEVKGEVVAGNLSMIVHGIGTTSDFDSTGKILVLEDIDEYLYHIDRMMVQLKRANILPKLSGLVLGHFSDMKDNTVPFGENAYEIIARNAFSYGYPIAFGFPMGHAPQNMPVPVGMKAKLTVTKEGSLLDFS